MLACTPQPHPSYLSTGGVEALKVSAPCPGAVTVGHGGQGTCQGDTGDGVAVGSMFWVGYFDSQCL